MARMHSFALLVFACGCSLADFDIDQPVPAQNIQGSPLPGPLASLFPLPLSLDLSSQIKAMDTGPIGSVTLSSLTLTITSPADGSQDWSFVQTVDVFVESTKSGTTLPKVQIANITSPGKVATMHFDVAAGVNLDPYINEGSQVDSTGMGDAPMHDMTYDGTGVFTVRSL